LPSPCRNQLGRVLLTTAIVLLFTVSSSFLLNDPVQATFLDLNNELAFSDQDAGNCTCQTTLTSYIIAYNTTTLTETTYLTSTTLISVTSTTFVPRTTTVTRTQLFTSTEKSVITSLSTVTLTSTSLANVTNTQIVTASTAQTTIRTTETATETSTTYTNVLATSTLTEVTTLISSASVTQTIAIFANPVGEVATAFLALAALAMILVPRIRSRRFISKVCPQCGYSNPPYAHSFCTKCGNPLKAPKT
jgi:ribosomal protein L40E